MGMKSVEYWPMRCMMRAAVASNRKRQKRQAHSKSFATPNASPRLATQHSPVTQRETPSAGFAPFTFHEARISHVSGRK